MAHEKMKDRASMEKLTEASSLFYIKVPAQMNFQYPNNIRSNEERNAGGLHLIDNRVAELDGIQNKA